MCRTSYETEEDKKKKQSESAKPKDEEKGDKKKKDKKKGGFKFKSPPKEAKEDTITAAGGKGSDSMSVEQTNELRAQLGLKPLRS